MPAAAAEPVCDEPAEPVCDCEPMEPLCDDESGVDALPLAPVCPALPDWLLAPACDPMPEAAGVLEEEVAELGLEVAWPLTPPVAELPALEPTCALAELWSGGVVLELALEGVLAADGEEAPAVALVWLDGEAALLCELMLAWSLAAGGFSGVELGGVLVLLEDGFDVPAATPDCPVSLAPVVPVVVVVVVEVWLEIPCWPPALLPVEPALADDAPELTVRCSLTPFTPGTALASFLASFLSFLLGTLPSRETTPFFTVI